MKRLVRDWLFGLRLLVRLLILSFCIAAGMSPLIAAQMLLITLNVQFPAFTLPLLFVIYLLVFCPFILVSYVRFAGYGSIIPPVDRLPTPATGK